MSIPSHGETLAARLYLPEGATTSRPVPLVVVLGPVASVKEQSPKQYATRLAARGVAAVTFDFRYFGASTGQPRQFENPTAKVEDLSAVIDHVATRTDIAPGALSVLGICQGVNWAVDGAVADDRIKRLAIVSGNYLFRDGVEAFFKAMFDGVTTVDERIAGGKAAREEYQRTGQVSYIPVVGDASVTDRLLPALPTYQYYIPWATHSPAWQFRGGWENRVTRMSEELIWSHRVDTALRQLNTPTLVIVGSRSATPPPQVHALFAACPAPHEIRNLGEVDAHVQFYDDPELIDRCIAEIAPWYLEA